MIEERVNKVVNAALEKCIEENMGDFENKWLSLREFLKLAQDSGVKAVVQLCNEETNSLWTGKQ